jgi:hypothetical protein
MFKCKCGKSFKDFRNGGFIQNLIVHCPECAGNKTFTVNVNGAVKHTTFNEALTMIRGLK